MTGYLGRMLRSAAGAEPALRPLAGSVFAAPIGNTTRRAQSTTPTTVETDQLATHPIESTEVAAPPKLPRNGSAPAPALSYAESYVPLLPPEPQTIAIHRNAFSAAPAEADEGSRTPQPRELSISVEAPRNPEQNLSPRAIGRLPVTDAHDDSATGTSEEAPQRAEMIPVTQRVNLIEKQAPSAIQQQMPPVLRPLTKGPVQPASPGSRVLPPAEPEVQIHIGRIEVLAVPPAPPRAPAPRPSRSTNLADYLSRRGGGR